MYANTTPSTEPSIRYGQTRTIAAELACLIGARQRCLATGNDSWRRKHSDNLNWIADNLLPSGSGIDNGTTVEWDASTEEKLVLRAGFHHMNDGGMYDGWTQHTIIVRPTFDGITVDVKGRNRNDIKDYLCETYSYTLSRRIRQRYDPTTEESTYQVVEE